MRRARASRLRHPGPTAAGDVPRGLPSARSAGPWPGSGRRDGGDGSNIVVRVSDTGLGISEDDQSGLFSAFFRTTNPAALSESGTGLGLAIVASIAERHAGHVDVESRLGEGTTFAVTLPAAGE